MSLNIKTSIGELTMLDMHFEKHGIRKYTAFYTLLYSIFLII
jgi:hypothetical protein